jgi:hypothetical protein
MSTGGNATGNDTAPLVPLDLPSMVESYIIDPSDRSWVAAWASFNTAFVVAFSYMVFMSMRAYCDITISDYEAVSTASTTEAKPMTAGGRLTIDRAFKRRMRLGIYQILVFVMAAITAVFLAVRDWIVFSNGADPNYCRACQIVLLRQPLIFIGIQISAHASFLKSIDHDRWNNLADASRKAKPNGPLNAARLYCEKTKACLGINHLKVVKAIWLALLMAMQAMVIWIAVDRWKETEHASYDYYLLVLLLWTTLAVYTYTCALARSVGLCGGLNTPISKEWGRCRHFTLALQLIVVAMIGFLSYTHLSGQIHNVARDIEPLCEDGTMRLYCMFLLIYFGTAVCGFYLYERLAIQNPQTIQELEQLLPKPSPPAAPTPVASKCCKTKTKPSKCKSKPSKRAPSPLPLPPRPRSVVHHPKAVEREEAEEEDEEEEEESADEQKHEDIEKEAVSNDESDSDNSDEDEVDEDYDYEVAAAAPAPATRTASRSSKRVARFEPVV